MTEQHPITPPPELVQEWASESLATQSLCNHAAQWGADQAFEACLKDLSILWDKEEIITLDDLLKHLRAARRPKPPSLKKQALALVEQHKDGCQPPSAMDWETVRLALEQLND